MLKAVLVLVMMMAMLEAKAELKVNYLKLNKFTEEETIKINKTAKVVEKILNSKEFKEKVINHTYNGKKQFIDTDLSNEEVYAKIMRGAETFYYPEANGNMDISLEMYYSMKNTIGYTYANSDTVWMNRKFHNKYDEYDQPNNLVHEWLHKLGFVHAQKWSKPRDFSVPYGVGSIVEELAGLLKKNPLALTPLNLPSPEEKPEAPKPVEISVPCKPEPKERVCYRSWENWFRLVCE